MRAFDEAGVEGLDLNIRAAGRALRRVHRQEHARLDAEGVGQLADVVDGDVAFAALDRTHIVAMQSGQLGQGFLRELLLLPEPAQVGGVALTEGGLAG